MKWQVRWTLLAIQLAASTVGGATTCRSQDELAAVREFVGQYCLDCHDTATKTAGLSLEALCDVAVDQNTEAWERVDKRLRARQMPPPDSTRPDDDRYRKMLASLEAQLDAVAAAKPRPGRTETFRRLNRVEYKNAVRDLLGLDVDVAALLPADEASHGFDNVTVSVLTPSLVNRYIGAATEISRLAMGGAQKSPGGTTIRVRPDVTQEQHVAGLPLGTRGGILFEHSFPRDGIYEIDVRLMRDRNEHVEGLTKPHQLEILIDRERMQLFDLEPPQDETAHLVADAHLKLRTKVAAGPHQVGVTFVKQSASLLESKRQPTSARFNMHRHPRLSPAVYQVSIIGPFESSGPGDTPSRRRILIAAPRTPDEEDECARQILAALARRAYRRPVDDDDLRIPLEFYRAARQRGDFEAGIEEAVSVILVNPNFLFRVERDPPGIESQTAYRISDFELASRLSFFLWSSIPDDELLDGAERGELSRPEMLERQVRRMLADERSRSLASNFAGQWLYLRNLDSITPDTRLFPDFDDNLRQAMRQETELYFDSICRADRSVLDFLRSDYTYLNERLAEHYRISHVYGSEFRRVALTPETHRGGLLRHGSILTVTSYATRTTPVIRGNWVLKNMVGLAPPPPPPNVPVLADNTVSAALPMRERLAQHRADPACANCHNLMDPVGFALENFDAVGRWRDHEVGRPVDAAGGLPDGSQFTGVDGLEQGLLTHPELFVGTLTERLLTFAVGRGVESYDAPAVRQIVRQAAADDYRFSYIIVGIVHSTPFTMRSSP